MRVETWFSALILPLYSVLFYPVLDRAGNKVVQLSSVIVIPSVAMVNTYANLRGTKFKFARHFLAQFQCNSNSLYLSVILH